MTFMRSALAMDPAARVSSREAVCHPLFEGMFEDYASRHPHLQQSGDDVGGGVGGGGGLQVGNANGGGVMMGGGGGGGTRCVKKHQLFGRRRAASASNHTTPAGCRHIFTRQMLVLPSSRRDTVPSPASCETCAEKCADGGSDIFYQRLPFASWFNTRTCALRALRPILLTHLLI